MKDAVADHEVKIKKLLGRCQEPKGTGKRGHIVAHYVSWAAKNWETFAVDTKCF